MGKGSKLREFCCAQPTGDASLAAFLVLISVRCDVYRIFIF